MFSLSFWPAVGIISSVFYILLGTTVGNSLVSNLHPLQSQPQIIQLLQSRLPNLLAVYAFGSQVTGTADSRSDLDLAVLVAGYADPIDLWDISSDIAELVNCDVDLLDFRAASTVMQYQILTTGQRLFAIDSADGFSVSGYEASLLSEMTTLNEARAGLLADIQKDGTVYGR